jgi:heavy metal sensor kinase
MNLSVRARLTLWFCLVSFCGVSLLGVSAYYSLQSGCSRVIDNELSSRLDGIENFLSEHITRLPLSRVQRELSQHAALKPAYLVIQDRAGATLYCGYAVGSICDAAAANMPNGFATDRQLRVLSVIRVVKGVPYRICLASDLTLETAILRRFFYWLLIVAPVALFSSALGGYWLSSRALKPVREIIAEVHAIGEQNLSVRLRIPKTRDEIQVLSETLNGMLGRIDRAFRQVTEITTNASHELRTPISVIRASAEIALLNARPTIEAHRNSLLQIGAEAEKCTRLLESMLMLARAESGAQPLRFVELSLAASVRQAFKTCLHLAEAKRITLSCEEDRTEVSVLADPNHLNRLWLLLLDNAIKYTPAGGCIAVRITLNAELEPLCEISDNGIGIDPKDLAKIFDRFYRTENAKLTGEPGSGLGLTIARRIAESHQARIDVTSERGTGSIFSVTFPPKTRTIQPAVPRSASSPSRDTLPQLTPGQS